MIDIVALLARRHLDHLIHTTLGRSTICGTTIAAVLIPIVAYFAKRTINYAITTLFRGNAGCRTTITTQNVAVVAHLTEFKPTITANRHSTGRTIANAVTEGRQCTRGAFGGAHASFDSLGRCTPCRHANAAFGANKLRAR